VTGRAFFTNSGELGFHRQWRRRLGYCGRRRDLPSLLRSNPVHPILIQRLKKEDTGSAVDFAKEPLRFCLFEPAVQSVFWKNTFLIKENVIRFGKRKIRFLIFTVLPLRLF
jgi:hypothetical protein